MSNNSTENSDIKNYLKGKSKKPSKNKKLIAVVKLDVGTGKEVLKIREG